MPCLNTNSTVARFPTVERRSNSILKKSKYIKVISIRGNSKQKADIWKKEVFHTSVQYVPATTTNYEM